MHASKPHASKPHASILPLVKTKFGLQTINMLLCHSCIVHSINKHSPGGRETLAIFPPDQSSLYGFLCVQRMPFKTCCNGGWVKTDSFKDSPPHACSITTHIFPEEHEMVWTTYRDSIQDSLILTSHSLQVMQLIYYTHQSLSVTTQHQWSPPVGTCQDGKSEVGAEGWGKGRNTANVYCYRYTIQWQAINNSMLQYYNSWFTSVQEFTAWQVYTLLLPIETRHINIERPTHLCSFHLI